MLTSLLSSCSLRGCSLLKANGVVLVVVGARDSNGLSLNLGVEPNELVRVVFNSARMGSHLTAYLWLTTSSLSVLDWCKQMLLAVVSVSISWLCVVCGEVLDGCGKWISY